MYREKFDTFKFLRVECIRLNETWEESIAFSQEWTESELCSRNDESLCWNCWASVLMITRGWRRSLFYLPVSCILAWKPYRLWLSFVAGKYIPLFHPTFCLSSLWRQDATEKQKNKKGILLYLKTWKAKVAKRIWKSVSLYNTEIPFNSHFPSWKTENN